MLGAGSAGVDEICGPEKTKQQAKGGFKALYSWGEVQSQVIILLGFVTTKNTFHITDGHLIHC